MSKFRLLFLLSFSAFAQHQVRVEAEADVAGRTIRVQEEIIFKNESDTEVSQLILNDWNNAFSTKDSPLAKRFSDEFVRSYFLAKDHEKGGTFDLELKRTDGSEISWERVKDQPDLIVVHLPRSLQKGDSFSLSASYLSKIPLAKFTRFGALDSGDWLLHDWLITPARFENGEFVRYSNENLDDVSNGSADYDISIRGIDGYKVVSDLDVSEENGQAKLSGKARNAFAIYIGKSAESYHRYKTDRLVVETNIGGRNMTDLQKALIIDRVTSFITENLGELPGGKIMVSEEDYLKNPVYGLNQLPGFLSPFPDAFLFELKLLKTYLNNLLQQNLKLDRRKDNWIFDGYQVYLMMDYMDRFYPEGKMMGNLANFKLLKSFHLVQLPFNEQYRYYYMLMARRNLDQPLSEPKDRLIKFNEQIASKYRAGLSLKYLDDYIGGEKVGFALKDFYRKASAGESDRKTFESDIKSITDKNLDWFFNTIVDSRQIVDYKFSDVKKTDDSISVRLTNRTGTTVPIPVYGVKGHEMVYKEWIENVATDTLLTFPRNGAEKIVINYQNEVPEFNMRNNWKSLKDFRITNRPIKFNFMKDLENPFYQQILYVPNFEYNYYDGIALGLRLHNKTLLEKPFVFDVAPGYGLKSKSLVGSASFAVNQYFRESRWYQGRYSMSGNYFHYAPDAIYYRLNPMVVFRRRAEDFRENKKDMIMARHVIVHREATDYVLDDLEENENYSVFNLRYGSSYMEATKTLNYEADLQFASKFGKFAFEAEYRKLFPSNRQLNLRFYGGAFLYNQTRNDFFSFALDRPTDYLFDYNYYGRSENDGLFSQQLILSEGGFKSRLDTPFANRWIATVNGSFNIWNWIEVYGDAGFVKNQGFDPEFVYDSGIRLNLVTDYFELYFPVYSKNGWEIAQNNYGEKIRFIVTIDPKTLVSLFTRKWF